MQLKMESRDSTPDISPLRSQNTDLINGDDDQEEGEISNEILSEISDGELCENLEEGELPCISSPCGNSEELPKSETQNEIDTDESKKVEPSQEMESPASPDLTSLATGSPVKIIPASPTNVQDERESETEDEDDIDEDILYLRLIALRSMACEESEQENMAREMHQLLEEADEAAQQDTAGDKSGQKASIDFEVELRKKTVKESFSPKQSTANLTDQPNSAGQIVQPPDIQIIDLTSPVPSPEKIPLPSLPPLPPPPRLPSPNSLPQPPAEPHTEGFNSEAFPMCGSAQNGFLTNKQVLGLGHFPPPPPPPPPKCPQMFCTSFSPPNEIVPGSSRSGTEPLPPGEETSSESISFQSQNSYSNYNDSKPQEKLYIGDQEAENRFFLSQEAYCSNLNMPITAWSHQNTESEPFNYYQTNYEYVPPMLVDSSNVPELPKNEIKPVPKRKRQHSRKSKSEEKRRKTSEGMEEDEEASLRALLLSQVTKKKENSAMIHDNKGAMKSTGEEASLVPNSVAPNITVVSQLQGKITNANADQTTSRPPSKQLNKSTSKKSIKAKENFRTTATKPIVKSASTVKVFKVPPRNAAGLNLTIGAKSVKGKSKGSLGISVDDQKKHFPNLTKKVIIPLNEDSGSDEERVEDVPVEKKRKPLNSGKQSGSFQFDLENFLKEVRNTSISKPTLSSISRTKVSSQLKATAQRLTPADKKKLVSSKISNLPLSKQREYQKLKELIAKKEQLKKNNLTKKSTKSENLPAISKNEEIEDENQLRQKLLQELQTKGSEKDKKETNESKPAQLRDPQLDRILTKGELTVEISGNKRSVSVPQKPQFDKNVEVKPSKRTDVPKSTKDSKEQAVKGRKIERLPKPDVSPEVQTLLENTEMSLIDGRKNLSSVLYKLSAQMSQLQRHSIECEKAVSFSMELKRQLKETEALVKAREKKVDHLKNVIRSSHEEVTLFKTRMLNAEDQCKTLGFKVYGTDYELPSQGSVNIRKKLEQIKTTAQKVKTTHTVPLGKINDIQEESGSQTLKTLEAECDLFLGSEYISPLEHIRSESDKGKVLDPDTLLCKFELGGKCMDSTCTFQHCRPTK